ncbi:hypothetical protein M5W83_02090 [Paenibacillus thiaminolyticus]|uniref:Uncharacterized protein n=1 Tax=Paenibacillus thiaminolyticus TaxID=49283 RepID=A0ABT4FTD7_PANTH|nr:hypothetical protein [Paenibacillus thiaminolyticus]MCY9535477.1 hypothetical protein [Paenibacillus thiaminolyticus]MCY9602172.1 hypothetical protein [Paenibacillus thiaminolyticus]MCY9605968.1 hypothetical protein [Paenibacillus thiaminolyticus]MCY9612375.1 hypothetical protein [Paenibacillus thiaminolyticus]MCY9621164.1 hypothetical protein [Paenibacillus thiaminolyticus]
MTAVIGCFSDKMKCWPDYDRNAERRTELLSEENKDLDRKIKYFLSA